MSKRMRAWNFKWLLTLMLLLLLTGLASGQNRFSTPDYNIFDPDQRVITDSVTGLQWVVGPFEDTGLYAARDWVNTLGRYWRLPTRLELKALHEAGVNLEDWGLFENYGGYWVWTGDFINPETPVYFSFAVDIGLAYYGDFEMAGRGRAFAVRSPRMGNSTGIDTSRICPTIL